MGRRRRHAWRWLGHDGGFLTVQFLLVVGLSLVLFTLAANLVVFQYGRGVVRAALDEGARAGSRTGQGVPDCQQRADDALDDLLGGAMRSGVSVTCAHLTPHMVARGQATFAGWLPAMPDYSFSAVAQVVSEEALP